MILDKGQPLEFGHTLEDQIGGQLEAGFVITGFYEDRYDNGESDPLIQVSGDVHCDQGGEGVGWLNLQQEDER